MSLERGKKFVWRGPGDPPVSLETLEDCVKHGVVGGLRAATITYGLRVGINVFVLMIRLVRYPKNFRFALIRRALFGTEPQAFGAMVGAFTALYKIILNILPILRIRWNRTRDLGAMGGFRTTFDYGADERSARPIPPGLTKPADLVPYPSEKSPPTEHMPPITREGSHIFEPLRAAAAGSIAGGIAILLEKPSNRTSLGQQILVRGLQGVFNVWSHRTGIVIPYGSVLLFGLCIAQIDYAFLLKPHTLPPLYNSWIQSITFSPLEAIKMNRSLVLTGRFEPEHLETLLDGRASPWKGRNSIVTPQNRVVMLEQLARAKAGDFSPLVASCKALHPHCTDCVPNTFIRVYNVAMRLLPWYTSLHLIPALLLRWRQVLRDPARSALKVVAGAIRSSVFIGIGVSWLQAGICILRNANTASHLPGPVAAFFQVVQRSKLAWWLFSGVPAFAMLIEDESRRAEIAMYVFPKALDSAWALFRADALGLQKRRRHAWKGDVALTSIGMGMLMTTYQTNPAALSGFVRSILYQLIGPN